MQPLFLEGSRLLQRGGGLPLVGFEGGDVRVVLSEGAVELREVGLHSVETGIDTVESRIDGVEPCVHPRLQFVDGTLVEEDAGEDGQDGNADGKGIVHVDCSLRLSLTRFVVQEAVALNSSYDARSRKNLTLAGVQGRCSMKKAVSAWIMCVAGMSLAVVGSAWAQPSHGPVKGTLLITGGATQAPDFERFIAMAGGKDARIVVIPTASITRPTDAEGVAKHCHSNSPLFDNVHCVVLHTTDRTVADSAEFVAPLKDATGVWLEGGRHWRLTDAYLDTRTLKELFAVLDRGGVIGGGSAGATVQGSYMVRGSSNPDDNTIMMAPGHEIGFGFFTNVTIDQHVDARGRANDLAAVMEKHPELLGLGLDQSTSITVHGDLLTVNGPKRVAVWDHKDHDGKGYYYLRTGDTLNTATRVATMVAHPADTP